MKRKILLAAFGLLSIASIVILALYIGIGYTVKSNIKHCQEVFPGTPEESLIAYMMDETRHPEDRSHIAIWTLGQIRSEDALPHLNKNYKNDPRGATCADSHDKDLCQYEIHKAIKSIEEGRLISYEKFKYTDD